MNRNILRLLSWFVLIPPVAMAFIATMVNRTNSPSREDWVWLAVAGILLFTVIGVGSVVRMQTKMSDQQREKIRSKGVDPDGYLDIAGTNMFLVPSVGAMFLSFFGLPPIGSWTLATVSFLGILWWLGVYRALTN